MTDVLAAHAAGSGFVRLTTKKIATYNAHLASFVKA